jgi:hypothetical protein
MIFELRKPTCECLPKLGRRILLQEMFDAAKSAGTINLFSKRRMLPGDSEGGGKKFRSRPSGPSCSRRRGSSAAAATPQAQSQPPAPSSNTCGFRTRHSRKRPVRISKGFIAYSYASACGKAVRPFKVLEPPLR